MSAEQMPPWLQEQVAKIQQTQNNLQSIMTQIQHLGMEKVETEKALEELNKVTDGETVFKHAGTVLIKSTKQQMIVELKESLEMINTRATVLGKQEKHIKESLKEQEAKINEMIKGSSANPAPKEENPRK